MFDGSLPEISDLASLSDAELVLAARGWTRVESAAAARKLAVMAEVFRRRSGCEDAEDRNNWWVDPTSAMASELAAAQGVSQGMALAQAHRGVMLADRLPRVAALFEAGLVSDLLARTVVYRTALIHDVSALAAVDAALAEQMTRWGALSHKKTVEHIDALVLFHDPGAIRRVRSAEHKLGVQFGNPTDEAGYMTIWARLYAPDGVALERKLDEMARSVCPEDPRTMNERRAAAMGALPLGQELVCECGSPDCAAAAKESVRADVIIHVVADEDAVAEARAKNETRQGHAECAAPAQDPVAKPAVCSAPAVVLGGGVITGPALAAFLGRAKLRPIRFPGDTPPEPRYQPSQALADFVRSRDLTCRFPGCDRPADRADIDHTIPYPAGPTCASNLKCLCRFHHLLKTFWDGERGWTDRQLPDGTVIWTSPTGQSHTTHPGSALLFPTLCRPTGAEVKRPAKTAIRDRGVKMPTRRRTREQSRAYRDAAERKLNDPLVAERNRPPPF